MRKKAGDTLWQLQKDGTEYINSFRQKIDDADKLHTTHLQTAIDEYLLRVKTF